MRFEFKNSKAHPFWSIRFYYGNSKDIRNLELNTNLISSLRKLKLWKNLEAPYEEGRARLTGLLDSTDHKLLQLVWSRKVDGIGPFVISDELGEWANEIATTILAEKEVNQFVLKTLEDDSTVPLGTFSKKIERHAVEIFAGIIVGSWFNTEGTRLLEPKRTAA
jgi:DNA (cytosine-5)-methyltransferase 1